MLEDLDIPKGLNLKNTNFTLSLETLELAQKCLSKFKAKEFFCTTLKKTVSYTVCVTCESSETCTLSQELENQIEICEFFLDLNVAKDPIKKRPKGC